MKKEALLTFLLLSGLTSVAQTTTITAYTPGVSTEGVVYYLPKTAINVSFTIEKSTYTPGELCQYAERYLRISNISKTEDMHYSIKSVSLSSEGLPDSAKAYHVAFTTNSVAPLITLSESGILLGVNSTDTVCAANEIVATPTNTTSNNATNPRDYMTEEMLMTGSKAKLAELTAKEIYNIRESRNLITRCQSENIPKDGEGIRIILDELQKQEEVLMQLFTGTSSTEYATQTFQIIPETDADKVVLGRFSRKLGILHPDDLAGVPIYIDIKGSNDVPMPVEEPEEDTKKKKAKTSKKKEDNQDGIVYNVPEKTEIKVYTNSETLAEKSFPIAQFGNVETLSSDFFSKKKAIKVTLSPTTGALLKVED